MVPFNTRRLWIALFSLALNNGTLAWMSSGGSDLIRDQIDFVSRHDFLVSASSLILVSANAPPTRSVDAGGGFDLLAKRQLSDKDVVFPISMEGLWNCERQVTSVEGDAFAAETVWRSLGGGKKRNFPRDKETFSTRYVSSSLVDNSYMVLDRGYEIGSRASTDNVMWTVEQPDQLTFDKTELSIVRRSLEVPTDEGFGYQELLRITDGPFVRAALVKRRYRRAFDEAGNRVVQGLEIVKTFRVLDGIAGTEFPTSTTKSQIRMTRPPQGGSS